MHVSDEDALRLVREGVDALRRGEAAAAREQFEALTHTGRANIQVWLLLATACRAAADPVGEEAALDALLAIDPRNIRARIMKGDCRIRAGEEGTAHGFYSSAVQIAAGLTLPPDLAAELSRAATATAELKNRLLAKQEEALVAQNLPAAARSARFQQSLDMFAGRKRLFVQEPTNYYFPELPAIQFFDPAAFSWATAIEAAVGDIRGEAERLLAAGLDGFTPYIRTDPNRPRADGSRLRDSLDWSALFLCENGRMFEDAVARCPKTWAAVQAAPLPFITSSPTVMFSLLRAGARIPAHTGTHNTRLVCHLPLFVPPGCGFRVGNEIRAWEEGKLLVFDDSIEHEAWNESDEDRLILIFDIWRPELTAREQREIGALFKAFALG